MNNYGSEGPGVSAKERQQIKDKNEHGMGLKSLNKNSLNSALPYAAKTDADVMFVQELNQFADKFKQLKTKLLDGKYLPKSDGDGAQRSTRWRMEGTPSVEGPNGGCAGGTAVLVRHHVGITAPKLPARKSSDNPYEVVPG